VYFSPSLCSGGARRDFIRKPIEVAAKFGPVSEEMIRVDPRQEAHARALPAPG
jgi:hypothetical protein